MHPALAENPRLTRVPCGVSPDHVANIVEILAILEPYFGERLPESEEMHVSVYETREDDPALQVAHAGDSIVLVPDLGVCGLANIRDFARCVVD
jgi:hypothetical protein